MKFTTDRPYGDPEKAARKLIEIANSIEAVQDGRIYIELINWPFRIGLVTGSQLTSAAEQLLAEALWSGFAA